MTVCFAAGFAAAVLLWLIIWSVKGLLLTPVKFGGSTRASITLSVDGPEPELEYTLRSLIWLRENGTLKADIGIVAIAPDDTTRSDKRQHRGRNIQKRRKRLCRGAHRA